MAKAKYEYVQPNGEAGEPRRFVSIIKDLVDQVNSRRSDDPQTRRASPVVFWYMGSDNVLYKADEEPWEEGDVLLNLRTVRIPPFIDWVVVAGPGGRHLDMKKPDLGAGWIRQWVEVPDEDYGENSNDLPPEADDVI
jgi:hypothetical protein